MSLHYNLYITIGFLFILDLSQVVFAVSTILHTLEYLYYQIPSNYLLIISISVRREDKKKHSF